MASRPPVRASRPSLRRRAARTSQSRGLPWAWLAAGAAGLALVAAILAHVLRTPSGSQSTPGTPGVSTPGTAPRHFADADVGRLAEQLGSRDLAARTAAARTLAALGPRAKDAVPELLDCMAKTASGIEFEVAVAKAMKSIGAAGLPDLLAALGSADPRRRFTAARALAKLGPLAASATPQLVAALERDRDDAVRASAATALGAIGPPAAAALPALRSLVGNPNTPFTGIPAKDELRVAAQMAMKKIQGDK
jgi:HEAT repeat protein